MTIYEVAIYQQGEMRRIRTKKIKNETSKYLMGPFDESLVQIMLDKNEKCIQEISRSNFEKVGELLRQIKTDCEMISNYNREKYVVRALSLNTEAYFHQKQNHHPEALKCLDLAESIEREQDLGPIDIARTKLNKSVILSHLGRHEEAINLGRQALELLKRKKEWQLFQLHKNQYKLYEIMTISFYNIASELTHLRDNEQALKVYKEGYYLAQRTLGPNHKLTLLLKSILKDNRETSKSKEKADLSGLKSNRTEIRGFKNNESMISNQKQKELKRIYASRRKVNSTDTREKINNKDVEHYMKSLEKIKGMYSKKNRVQKRFKMVALGGEQQHRNSRTRSNGLAAEVENRHRYDQVEHQKVKDILLHGKRINHSKIYGSQRSKTENAFEFPVEKTKINMSTTLEPIFPGLEAKKEEEQLTFPQIVSKVEQKTQQKGSDCQLI